MYLLTVGYVGESSKLIKFELVWWGLGGYGAHFEVRVGIEGQIGSSWFKLGWSSPGPHYGYLPAPSHTQSAHKTPHQPQ